MISPCIGIDLGTTYSCVGIYKNGTVEIIANEHGNRTIPSYVSFTPEERYIGEDAKNMASQNPTNTIYDAKRLIGRKFNERTVQNDIAQFPFKVTADQENRPLITVNYLEETHNFYPEQISAMILEKIKSQAEKYLGTTVTDAVVTVPAYFNDAQRQATKDAGKLAGLNILRIINEPTAAAIAYGLNETGEKNILVYDLGGGTLDVTILTIDNGVFDVKSTSGDTHLGGEDFDHSLRDYILLNFAEKKLFKTKTLTEDDKKHIFNKFNISNIYELSKKNNLKDYISDENTDNVNNYINNVIVFQKLKNNHKMMRKLLTLCEQSKKTLSTSNIAQINIDNFFDGEDMSMNITRSKFEELCSECFTRSLEPIHKALKDAKMTTVDINDVVLIGGSTRIPKIQSLLNELFPGKLKSNINPDEAVAFGAAVQGAILSNNGDNRTDKLVLLDITPLSLGIETAGGVMSVMIKRNTPIPCDVTEVFSTFCDNQPGVTVRVFEGERSMTKDNNSLGTFELLGIPPMKKGQPRIKVKFMVDVNGIMSVEAIEESTNKQNKILIENKKGRLDDSIIEKMIKDSERFCEKDKMAKEKIESKNKLDCYINSAKNSLDTSEVKIKLGEEKFSEIISKIINIEDWLEESEGILTINKEDYDNKYKDLESFLIPILKTIME
jgi:L1 cell adhesion molecule like protein